MRAGRNDTDSGSIIALDLLVTGVVAGVLLLAVGGVLSAASSARLTIDRAAELSDRRGLLEDRLDHLFGGALAPDVCRERVDPTVAAAWSNCSLRSIGSERLSSATPTEVCAVVRSDDGLDIAGGAPGLVLPELHCALFDEVVGLSIERRVAVGGDRVAPQWSTTPVGREVLLVEVARVVERAGVTDVAVSPWRYFDVDGLELVPGGSPAALDELQRAAVARVRLTLDIPVSGASSGAVWTEWQVGSPSPPSASAWEGR